MFNLIAKLIGGAAAPLVRQLSAFGASLLRKLALFLAAAICMVVVIASLTIAFALWIASIAGPIVGVLAVALLYLVLAILAAALALRGPTQPAPAAAQAAADQEHATERTSRGAKIDEFAAPLLEALNRFGLRREQLAVLAGASIAKQLRPVPLVGLAILAGFLVGRIWKGWGALASTDLVATLLGLFGRTSPADGHEGDPEERTVA